MIKPMDMRFKLYLTLAAIGTISLVGGLVMIWYTYQAQQLLTDILEKNIAAFQSAEAMENALFNQKGVVTYYYLDNDPAWLKELNGYRELFKKHLNDARLLHLNSDQMEALRQIEERYGGYMRVKDQVIDHYQNGRRDDGAKLHRTIRQEFTEVLKLCENYKQLQTDGIRATQEKNAREARRLRHIALAAAALSTSLVILLSVILTRQILNPLFMLLASTSGSACVDRSGNIVSALSDSVEGLIRNADQIQQDLDKSREHLAQSEKLAMVGKLAAGMAHSIRNPFTSVKMRLFSLNRSLRLTSAQKEDFDVILEEIRHIDTIVQNFLEFSRPPKLVMQRISPSAIVDATLQLLSHRLKSYSVTTEVRRRFDLPAVTADPEQVKEVLVNIIVNACEAMADGGRILIEETVEGAQGEPQAVLRISDTGPGVSPPDREQLFQPFFTTKDDGTGLGLSIARRIMEEHGGSLSLCAPFNGGACFLLTFPLHRGERP
jgi:signal transduction histidine kinase